ncbi:MAG: hypothetical protein BGO52_07655 [Sphingobacteriales bacterium 44-61]|nr:MAG: hypothetical protein BGO52_07655 [Sphingobacteriales bacterium 44-61]
MLFLSLTSQAQTAAEWTSQKKTQIKYLLQQIAANKVYIEYIEKGYGIARKGLNTIQKIKQGDFDLHRDFISSLSTVNPKVKNYTRVGDIIAYQVRIVKDIKTVISNLKESNQFNPDELDYSKAIFERLLEDCLKSMDELFLVITSGELQMKDDERIQRIDGLWLDMQDKYAFCKSFSEECSVLAMQRLMETGDVDLSKKLNGLK